MKVKLLSLLVISVFASIFTWTMERDLDLLFFKSETGKTYPLAIPETGQVKDLKEKLAQK